MPQTRVIEKWNELSDSELKIVQRFVNNVVARVELNTVANPLSTFNGGAERYLSAMTAELEAVVKAQNVETTPTH